MDEAKEEAMEAKMDCCKGTGTVGYKGTGKDNYRVGHVQPSGQPRTMVGGKKVKC